MKLLIFQINLYNLKITDISLYKNNNVYIIEEPFYMLNKSYNYHKLKLVYHRATMKSYSDYLKNEINIKNIYIDYKNVKEFYKKLKTNNEKIIIFDPNDFELENKLRQKFGTNLIILDNYNFTLTKQNIIDNKTIFLDKNNKLNFQNFYKWQRKRLDILMTKDNKPLNGKWVYDTDNRKKINSDEKIYGTTNIYNNNIYIKEAQKYIENSQDFKNSYGDITNYYPINHKETKAWFKNFLKTKFKNFGKYQDATINNINEPFLYHSALTPMNIGLITDNEIIKYIKKHNDELLKNIEINSYEGFIRQIIGWRNYIYVSYILFYDNINIEFNILNNNNKINLNLLWNGNTKIEFIDNLIIKIKKYGYIHHIERLMYLGNYLLLLQINPTLVYNLFMEWTIDAYNWVMFGNIYGMSQYSIENVMKRPYFSSANYILKMSTFKKGEWVDIFNALYYYFIYSKKNNKYFKNKNVGINLWNKKNSQEQSKIIKIAEDYINYMCNV